jgi:hypothetical protein
VSRSEAARGAAGNFGFTELRVGKRDRKRVDSRARAAGKGGDGGGIKSATQKHADRNIGYHVTLHGIDQRGFDAGQMI